MNLVIVTGRVVKDLKLKTIKDKRCLLFSIVVFNGKQRKSSFYKCIAWGDVNIDYLMDKLERGTEAIFIGKLTQSQWKGKNGEFRERVRIMINRVELKGQTAPRTIDDSVFTVTCEGDETQEEDYENDFSDIPI